MSKRYQIRAISWGRRSNKSQIVEAAAMEAWRRGARIVQARLEDGEVRWTKWIPKTEFQGEITIDAPSHSGGMSMSGRAIRRAREAIAGLTKYPLNENYWPRPLPDDVVSHIAATAFAVDALERAVVALQDYMNNPAPHWDPPP